MKITPLAGALATMLAFGSPASPAAGEDVAIGEVRTIDLPTTLALAGARDIDVEIAVEELRIARARSAAERTRFFPWLTAGAGWRRHEGALPDVVGVVLDDVDKQAWEAGATLQAEVQTGDALFGARSARRGVEAASHGVDAERTDAVLQAALAYFDLLAAQVRIEVFSEAERISSLYEREVARAVEAGLSARSEELRVRVEAEKHRISVERAEEERRVAAARLAEALRVGATADLHASRDDIAPVALVPEGLSLQALIDHALDAHPKVQRSASLVAAARERRKGVVYGPLLPTIGGQVGGGGLGGGPDGSRDHTGDTADYAAGLRWRIGPGGLLDLPRIEMASAELRRVELEEARLRDAVSRLVVENASRRDSLARRLESTRKALTTTETSLALARERREFGIDVVLENILAEQELTRARADHLLTVIDRNRAEYALLHALGGQPPAAGAEPR